MRIASSVKTMLGLRRPPKHIRVRRLCILIADEIEKQIELGNFKIDESNPNESILKLNITND